MEKAVVYDKDGNEIYFGETCGECQKWCLNNGITGSNGEYIALGKYDVMRKYFDKEDYEEINNDAWRDCI